MISPIDPFKGLPYWPKLGNIGSLLALGTPLKFATFKGFWQRPGSGNSTWSCADSTNPSAKANLRLASEATLQEF